MTRPPLILLPGLDGTGELFAPFIAAAPRAVEVRVLALPDERSLSYHELAEWLCGQLPQQSVVLLRARRDRLVRLESASRIQALRPSTELAHIDAPHLLLQANPAAAWSFVAPFLERIAQAPDGPGPHPPASGNGSEPV